MDFSAPPACTPLCVNSNQLLPSKNKTIATKHRTYHPMQSNACNCTCLRVGVEKYRSKCSPRPCCPLERAYDFPTYFNNFINKAEPVFEHREVVLTLNKQYQLFCSLPFCMCQQFFNGVFWNHLIDASNPADSRSVKLDLIRYQVMVDGQFILIGIICSKKNVVFT